MPENRVETGLAPSQTAEQAADQLNLALDFGWRSASALRKDLALLHEREGHGFSRATQNQLKRRALAPAGLGRLPLKPLEKDCHPNEVRDLQFAVEENHASSGTLRNNSVSHLLLSGALLYLEENPKLDAAVEYKVSKAARGTRLQYSYNVARYQAQRWLLTRSYISTTLWHMAKSKKKAGGKPLKDEVVRFRVSTNQKAAFEAAAQRDGLEVSAWLRRLALREAGELPEAK